MAFDAFLKLDGVDGESSDKGHEKWIDLLSFSWGAAAQRPAFFGGGGAAGRIAPQSFTFTKLTDSASPNIFIKLDQGAAFQKVSLACRLGGTPGSTDSAQVDFLKIDFYNVLISSYNAGGNIGTDQQPLESVSFAFQKIEYNVMPSSPTGVTVTPTIANWDFASFRQD